MNTENVTAYIKEIALPEELLPAMIRINELILECLNKGGESINSGILNLDSNQIDERLDLALFYVRWISSTNGVIDNLNIVLADLKTLPNKYYLFPGHPDDRYYLLLRTYFYEFYRFREIHNRIIKESAMRGIIDRIDVDSHRKEFHSAFKDVIELRNTLVHSTPIWTGKKHVRLKMHGMATHHGFSLQDIRTGEIRDIKDSLEDACAHVFAILQDEGNRMSIVVQRLVDWHFHVATTNSPT